MSILFALRFIYIQEKSDFSLVYRIRETVHTCRLLEKHELELCLREASEVGLKEKCPFTPKTVGIRHKFTGWCVLDKTTGMYYTYSSFVNMYLYAVRYLSCFFAERTYYKEDVLEFEEFVCSGEMNGHVHEKMLYMFSLGFRSPVYIAWSCCTGMDIVGLHDVLLKTKTFTVYFGEEPA